jgi:hypothetical protein
MFLPRLAWNCAPLNLSLLPSLGGQVHASVPSYWLRWDLTVFFPRLSSNCDTPDESQSAKLRNSVLNYSSSHKKNVSLWQHQPLQRIQLSSSNFSSSFRNHSWYHSSREACLNSSSPVQVQIQRKTPNACMCMLVYLSIYLSIIYLSTYLSIYHLSSV